MQDFGVLEKFNYNIIPPKALIIKEVLWSSPRNSWIKCNIDGATLGCPGLSACGGIFKGHDIIFRGCFDEKLPLENAFQAVGALRAIEIAKEKSGNFLWIEIDTQLLVLNFKNKSLIPCSLRYKWE